LRRQYQAVRPVRQHRKNGPGDGSLGGVGAQSE